MLFAGSFAPTAYASASVPPTILTYQGRLTDASGNLLGGTGTNYYLQFSIWTTPTVGTGMQVWPATTPGTTTVNVAQGVFTVNIGDTANGYPDPLNLNFTNNSALYLQVQVSANNITSETLSPRQQLTSAVFAQVAGAIVGTTTASLFGTTTPIGSSFITAQATSSTSIPLTLAGTSGQSANLFQIVSNSLSNLFSVSSSGAVTMASLGNFNGGFLSTASSTITSGLFSANGGASTTVLTSTGNAYFATSGGSVGVGTTTPATGFALAIQGNTYHSGTSYFGGLGTFNSGLTAFGQSAFANASSTAFSSNTFAAGATGTTSVSSNGTLTAPNITIGSLGGLLKATAGVISAAVAGVDYANFSWPFTPGTNFGASEVSTSTTEFFQNGIQASSTVQFGNSNASNFTYDSANGALDLGTYSSLPQTPLRISTTTNNYVQSLIQNLSNGNNASADLIISNDKDATANTYYTDLGIDSSGYNQSAFSAENAGDSFLTASDGALVIGTASSTNSLADIRFETKGTASSSIREIITAAGNIGIGTTSPSQALSVQGNGLFSGNISAAAITATSTLNVAGLSTFTNGLLSLASSTVGNGNQNGGLTVSGGATTTGNAYFPSGSVGIGIQPIANALNLGTGVNVRLTLNSHLYAASRYTDSQGGNIIYDNGTGTNFVLAETASNVFTFGGGVENSAPSLSVLSLNTSTGNVGVGTTTPGSLLSVGNTGGINFSPTATSTFGSSANGINITNGCFAIAGVCVGGSGGGVSLSAANTWTALQTFQNAFISQASSTVTGLFTAAAGLALNGQNTTGGGLIQSNNTSGYQFGSGAPSASVPTLIPNRSTTNAGIGADTAGDVSIITNNGGGTTEMFRATGTNSVFLNGNVGFGSAATSPQAQVESRNDGSALEDLINVRNNNGTPNGTLGSRIGFGVYRNVDPTALGASIDAINTSGTVNGNTSQGATLIFNTTAEGSAGLQERMRILNTGNIGIASSSPWGLLSINANAIGSNPMFVIGSSTATNLVVSSAGQLGIGNDPTPDFETEITGTSGSGYFGVSSLPTTNGDIFTINGSGSVGIASTTPGSILSLGTTGGINFSSTATSTFGSGVNGINLTNGCFALKGVCIGGGSGGGASLSVANTWTALQTFQLGLISQASSTIGNGTQTGGLTISGGATTTGNAYIAGGLGIGTTTNSSYALTLGNGTNIDSMIMAVAASTNTQTLGISGAGTRMFWYPAKAAFRAGTITTTGDWDDANIGSQSFAAGQDCEASGQFSDCIGVNGIASGGSSIAIGDSVTANNTGATAIGGGGTQASGVNSFAMSGGFALADDSFAFGGGNIGQARVNTGATGGIAIGNAQVSASFSNAFGTVVPAGTFPNVSGLNSTAFFLGDQSGSVLSGNGSMGFWLGGQTGTSLTVSQNNLFSVVGGTVAFGTSSASAILEVASSSVSTTFKGQLSLTDTNAGANLKHWLFSSEGGNLYIATTSDSFATSSISNFTMMNNGRIGIGSTTPGAFFSVNPPALGANIAEFMIGSSTQTSFIVKSNNFVGVGTTSPSSLFSVSGSTYFGSGTASTMTIQSGIINYPIQSTSTIASPPVGGTGVGVWNISTSTSAAGSSILSINSSAGTTTISFFGATTTALTAGVGVGINGGYRNGVIIGNGKVQSNVTIANGSLCVSGLGWCTASSTPTLGGSITARNFNTVATEDVAEMYQSDALLKAGSLVAISSNNADSVTLATANNASSTVGAVSTDPGFTLGDGPQSSGEYPIALSGQVPVYVNLDNGPIQPGDHITVSTTTPGVGMKAGPFDPSVGIALGSYTAASSSNSILVFMQARQGTDINGVGQALGITQHAANAFSDLASALSELGNSVFNTTAQLAKLVIGEVVAKTAVIGSVFTQHLFASQVDVGTASQPAGITLYDTATHAPYCLTVTNGAPAATSGACGSTTPSSMGSGTSTPSTPPTITLVGSAQAQLHVGDTFQDPGATAQDAAGNSLDVHTFLNGIAMSPIQIDTSTSSTYEIEYSATDGNGTSATTTRSVVVSQ